MRANSMVKHREIFSKTNVQYKQYVPHIPCLVFAKDGSKHASSVFQQQHMRGLE